MALLVAVINELNLISLLINDWSLIANYLVGLLECSLIKMLSDDYEYYFRINALEGF